MRKKKYLDQNVLEAAKERARKLFSAYDDIVIAFSGGKDSLVVLELMDMVRRELGIEKKLNVVLWDEELLSDGLASFIEKIARSGRFNFRWICAPFVSEKFILGKKYRYLQWDATREFVRTPPDIAECYFDMEPVHESDAFDMILRQDYGNVVECLGIRAQESLNRLKGVLKASDPYSAYLLNKTAGYAVSKPIYDWTTEDVFKFFLDNGIEYAPVYNQQIWSKSPLRVATPFTNEGAKFLHRIKEQDPVFYDRITTIFPEMMVQERYYKDYNLDKEYDKYGVTPMGIIRYIHDNLNGGDKAKALKELARLLNGRRVDRQESGRYPGRYPLFYIFYNIIIGTYKRYISNINDVDLTPRLMAYEDAYEEWKKANPDYEYE